ncbi:MAG: phosphoglycerate mutase, partial [Clostridia bacterium]|nr:phosphoglycerate mutase [Clostridia bacterium]
MKYVVFLGDGMADLPYAGLDNKTPLEVAKHPNLDKLAREGYFGLARTVPEGMPAGSDTANLSVFGYDPEIYYSGRSPLEAVSLGIDLDQRDVTYRCNTVTLSEADSIEDAVMLDYSAGEIESELSKQLIEAAQVKFGCEALKLYNGISYRHCLVLKDAQSGGEQTPPHDISKRPVKGHLPTGVNSEKLLE